MHWLGFNTQRITSVRGSLQKRLRTLKKPLPKGLRFDRDEPMPGERFLDTHVLIYAFASHDPHKRSRRRTPR
jgi:hypothetical protein